MRRFGNYEILSLIGRGGMAEVHRARALAGPFRGKDVALKRLMPEHSEDLAYVDLFTGEADIGRWLDHPHIVQLIDAGVLENIFYIAMEWVEGHDLATIIYRCQELRVVFPIEFAVYMVSCILEALAYAHAAFNPTGTHLRLVHCDVTPSNIFVSRSGDVKLGDFGVARARAVVGDGQSYGKPSYLSPEQIEGAEVNPRIDLWAVGVILYELLAGRRPFRGESAEAIARDILRASPQPIHQIRPEVPMGLSEVLEQAFQRDPEARYQTAEFFLEAIEPFQAPAVADAPALAQLIHGLFAPGA